MLGNTFFWPILRAPRSRSATIRSRFSFVFEGPFVPVALASFSKFIDGLPSPRFIVNDGAFGEGWDPRRLRRKGQNFWREYCMRSSFDVLQVQWIDVARNHDLKKLETRNSNIKR